MLQAAEEIASSSGLEQLTITGVAERARVSVGTIYRRFEGKDQLITALTERMLERREEYVAEQLRAAEALLSGVMDAYAHSLLQSFVDSSNLFPELLRASGGRRAAAGGGGVKRLRPSTLVAVLQRGEQGDALVPELVALGPQLGDCGVLQAGRAGGPLPVDVEAAVDRRHRSVPS